MKDLQGHSIGYSFERQQQQHDDDHDHSENFTQTQAQHPLLEHHFSIEPHSERQRRRRQENSISAGAREHEPEAEGGEHEEDADADTMQEGQLFDCPLDYGRQQQSSNFINYCKQNNNPHQSINKPTDGAGGQSQSHIIRYLAGAETRLELDEEEEEAEELEGEEDAQLFAIDSDQWADSEAGAGAPSPPASLTGRLHKPASSPIQVPARRTRRGLHSMKLNMLKVEEEAAAAAAAASSLTLPLDESTSSSCKGASSSDSEDFSPVRRGDRNRPAILENMAAFERHDDDDSAFLEREFNENHYNHYLVDGFDDEHLTAEEDPMRLFASIQALAKSLHEDAELFGSLPPKRMLESPIRSMAYAR